MGADIIGYVEVRKHGEWEVAVKSIDLPRNYDLWSAIFAQPRRLKDYGDLRLAYDFLPPLTDYKVAKKPVGLVQRWMSEGWDIYATSTNWDEGHTPFCLPFSRIAGKREKRRFTTWKCEDYIESHEFPLSTTVEYVPMAEYQALWDKLAGLAKLWGNDNVRLVGYFHG